MRTIAMAGLLGLGLLTPAAAPAQEPERVELKVGERERMAGFRPLCDDASVADFTDDGGLVLTGRKPGETLCSLSTGSPLGPRQVFRVVVVPAPPKGERP